MSGVTVVKLGGSLLEDPVRRESALDAIAARARRHRGRGHIADPLVVVHGGGRHVDGWLSRLGLPRAIHQGIRITDEPTLDVVIAVLSGLVNKTLVAELAARGLRAFGLSGVDAGLLTASRMEADGSADFGHVGQVTRCNADAVRTLIEAGHIPVIASLALSESGQILNINADAAASAIAVALPARRLVFLTDVDGLLDSRGRRVSRLNAAGARVLLQTPIVTGGMRPKLNACLQALASGVDQILIAGPRQHERALLRGEGGTRLVAA